MKMDRYDHTDTPREIRLKKGLLPEEVESLLNMITQSCRLSSDDFGNLEDLSWDSAYGDGNEDHTFVLAKTVEKGTDRTVGFICYGPLERRPGEYELISIAVDPEFRRLGIGTALVDEMVRRLTADRGRQIFLETGDDRSFEGARQFYEANDFVLEIRHCRQFIPMDGGVVYRMRIESGEIEPNYH